VDTPARKPLPSTATPLARVKKGRGERMADIEITQAEADALIEMEKRFVDYNDWTFPAAGEWKSLELTCLDKCST
jgi:hypothetical protein